MSNQRYQPHETVKEPHAVSLKVLRLSRPSLVPQYPVQSPLTAPHLHALPIPASLAYLSGEDSGTNPDPFVLSPIINLPPSFGSAYVGETFSCTLCANHDVVELPPAKGTDSHSAAIIKFTRDVRIEAEMKIPGSATAVKLELGPDSGQPVSTQGVDLDEGQTLQKIVNFDLKEEGNHVLAVTVSYYEATNLGGRTRTFRKLYQFICKPSLIVRTKPAPLSPRPKGNRQWVLEAQLENCSEDVMQLEKVVLEPENNLEYSDCNWEISESQKPVLHPGEVEQVCFVIGEKVSGTVAAPADPDARVPLGVLGISWRGEMGHRGFISTGKLGSRYARATA